MRFEFKPSFYYFFLLTAILLYGIIKGEKMRDLTERQAEILDFIKQNQIKRGMSPTIREIMQHFGFKAIGTVQDHLAALIRKGFIKRSSLARSIELLGIKRPQIIDVPILGTVSAGKPLLAIENIEGYVSIDKDWVGSKEVFALKVKGESMIDAGIFPSDYAIVRQQDTAQNGEIVVVLIEDEAILKRFYKKKDKIILKAENPQIKPIIFKKSEAGDINIIGKVIGVYRRY